MPDKRANRKLEFGRIDVENTDYHQQSHSEIGGDNRIYRQ